MQIKVWNSSGRTAQPARLLEAQLDRERVLQDWVINDPSLVEDGLTVIGSELHLDARRRVDVLAVDASGALVVIELKADALAREVIAQTIDYVARLSAMERDELEPVLRDACARQRVDFDRIDLDAAVLEPVRGVAVGIGAGQQVEQMAGYLQRFEVPIRHIGFQLLEKDGDLLLIRQVDPTADQDASARQREGVPHRAAEEVFGRDAFKALGAALVELAGTCEELELPAIGHKYSVKVTAAGEPDAHAVLLTDERSKGPWIYFSADAFNEFFDTDPDAVRAVFGTDHDRIPLDAALCERLSRALPDLVRPLSDS